MIAIEEGYASVLVNNVKISQEDKQRTQWSVIIGLKHP